MDLDFGMNLCYSAVNKDVDSVMKITVTRQHKPSKNLYSCFKSLRFLAVILCISAIAGCQTSSLLHKVPPQWEPTIQTLED